MWQNLNTREQSTYDMKNEVCRILKHSNEYMQP